MRAFVTLAGVSMDFPTQDGTISALKDISLSIAEGEFFCLVGPSGCGKTTLLNILAGFLRPTAGNVLLDGKEVVGPGAERGVIFQQPVALLPWLDVSENVEFGLKLRGVPKAERRRIIEHYIRMVRLWEFRGRPPYELSGGMQQRVALARVLANDPRMLLMDEPFGALDALTREKMQEELLRLVRQTGKTVFFITHSVEEAIFLGTTVAVMSEAPGRILATIPVAFGPDRYALDSRSLKSSAEFVRLREEVLKLIWDTAG
jgi:ABC-type taurine transport system ATPase subunit